jgi:hypothetical protein
MYELVLEKRTKGGFYKQIFHSVDASTWRAKELASKLRLFPTYRDGGREVVYSDINSEYKMYVMRLDRWW